MEAPHTKVNAFYKTLTVLFAGMLAGLILFAGIALFVRKLHILNEMSLAMNQILAIIVLIVMVSGFFASNYFFQNRMLHVRNEASLSGKLSEYRTALIIRLALIEAPALFTTIAYMLTGDKIFMGLAVIIILFFLSLKPSREDLAGDLELRGTEALESEQDDALV